MSNQSEFLVHALAHHQSLPTSTQPSEAIAMMLSLLLYGQYKVGCHVMP